MKKARKRIEFSPDIEKEIYFDNQKSIVDQFRESLAEPKTEFITRSIFITIISQEDFIEHITKNPHKFATVKNEEEVLQLLIKEAKAVYGKEFEGLYQGLKKEREK